jgi:hypothetical protein
MKECDNDKIHISNDFTLSMCLLIIMNNLLLLLWILSSGFGTGGEGGHSDKLFKEIFFSNFHLRRIFFAVPLTHWPRRYMSGSDVYQSEVPRTAATELMISHFRLARLDQQAVCSESSSYPIALVLHFPSSSQSARSYLLKGEAKAKTFRYLSF